MWHDVGRTLDSFPTPKFLKITQGDSSLRGKFLPKKSKIFAVFEQLKPTFLYGRLT